jgi:hypothetical protein
MCFYSCCAAMVGSDRRLVHYQAVWATHRVSVYITHAQAHSCLSISATHTFWVWLRDNVGIRACAARTYIYIYIYSCPACVCFHTILVFHWAVLETHRVPVYIGIHWFAHAHTHLMGAAGILSRSPRQTVPTDSHR